MAGFPEEFEDSLDGGPVADLQLDEHWRPLLGEEPARPPEHRELVAFDVDFQEGDRLREVELAENIVERRGANHLLDRACVGRQGVCLCDRAECAVRTSSDHGRTQDRRALGLRGSHLGDDHVPQPERAQVLGAAGIGLECEDAACMARKDMAIEPHVRSDIDRQAAWTDVARDERDLLLEGAQGDMSKDTEGVQRARGQQPQCKGFEGRHSKPRSPRAEGGPARRAALAPPSTWKRVWHDGFAHVGAGIAGRCRPGLPGSVAPCESRVSRVCARASPVRSRARSPLRVLIDARLRTARTTGAGRVLEGLVPALARAEPDLEYLLLTSTPDCWPDLPPCVELIETDVPVAGPSQHWRLHSTLRDLRPDVFHYPMFDLPLCARVPSVIVLHDLIPIDEPHYFGRGRLGRRIAARVLHRLSVSRCEIVMTPTEAIRREVIGRYRLDPARVVAGPWGFERAAGPVAEEREMRERLGIEGPYLLCVGVHRPHKNLERLIEAFASLGRGRDLRLVLAGSLDDRFPGPRRVAHRLGLGDRVLFPGHVDVADRNALYRHAELFVFPSIAEGFGFPLLEAFDQGAPAACSDIAVHREVAGDAAAYFDPLRAEEMAAVLDELLGDAPRTAAMRVRGESRLDRFSWDRTALTTLDAYRRAAGAAGFPRRPGSGGTPSAGSA